MDRIFDLVRDNPEDGVTMRQGRPPIEALKAVSLLEQLNLEVINEREENGSETTALV